MPAREFGKLLVHIAVQCIDQRPALRLSDGQTLLRTLAIDGALDFEQGVDPAYHLDRDRRQRDFLFAGGLAARVLLDIGHGKKRPTRVAPTGCFIDRPRFSPRKIELVIAVKGIGLQDAGVLGQVRLRVLALAIGRVIKYRRRRRRAAKWPVIPDIDPAPARDRLALGQDRYRRIITVEPFGGQNMRFDTPQQRLQRRTHRAHRIGHGRQRDRHPFEFIALALPV